MRIHYTLKALPKETVQVVPKDEGYVRRAWDKKITLQEYEFLSKTVKFVGVSDRFRHVIELFKTPEGETPAGFRVECALKENSLLEIDLVRDISYDKNGKKRPTGFLFSADTANPYEIEPVKDIVANLTCNPGIIYDMFINNEKANIGHKYKTRNEVMKEIGNILGPGCDISVEVNDPFADFSRILEEAAEFREMLSEYRVVIKIPHMGPINGNNAEQLLTGSKKLSARYDAVPTADGMRGHNLALKLKEHGYRINYTLMFEPWQAALALQAKPYFINSFVRQRAGVTTYINGLYAAYTQTRDDRFLEDLRKFFVEWDFLSGEDAKADLTLVEKMARETVAYRKINEPEGSDGLDGVRHNLRMLRHCNLEDTRLIVCSLDGTRNYPDLDKLLVEPEFSDVIDRLVITADPAYLARFTSSPQVITYQRKFLNAAKGEN
jgi:transaldolase